MNSDVSRVSVEIGGNEISFETGKLAKQASGAVVVQAGDTMVLSTATAGNLRDVGLAWTASAILHTLIAHTRARTRHRVDG